MPIRVSKSWLLSPFGETLVTMAASLLPIHYMMVQDNLAYFHPQAILDGVRVTFKPEMIFRDHNMGTRGAIASKLPFVHCF